MMDWEWRSPDIPQALRWGRSEDCGSGMGPDQKHSDFRLKKTNNNNENKHIITYKTSPILYFIFTRFENRISKK